MKQYEYVTVKSKGIIARYFDAHREIIDDYASRGYRYVGFIPTTIVGQGEISEMDLVFEKDAN